jgi:hypothetical protein
MMIIVIHWRRKEKENMEANCLGRFLKMICAPIKAFFILQKIRRRI